MSDEEGVTLKEVCMCIITLVLLVMSCRADSLMRTAETWLRNNP